ncbi:sigma-70 family RNA polymerase sigma factor [Paenibacillus sp. J22TS3]|uniref:sigma-70 family RNA polymerase sigma factor n=1 Tax=Paenibacillus sp. J22TS3 TaxID=2807192 RepID=UPI001B1CFE2B|nr:sigma-70 family RNA polymerase sigma factor [Paenibacillus sp. J22TS3]GIP22059.1 RNA polymerase sigma factor SigJ [Paenibacillus sp. J22TS3]
MVNGKLNIEAHQDKAEALDGGNAPQGKDLEQLYRSYRPYAFMVAYRLLGSVSDAEDVVQDWFTEMHGRPLSTVENWKAYTARSITNRCLNLMKSARRRREGYVGEWLPEPLPHSYWTPALMDGPYEAAEQADTLSYAYLVMLEKLSAAERVVFVLREMFEYDYGTISDILGKSEVSCRKIFSRARQRLAGESATNLDYDVASGTPSHKLKLMNRFVEAVQHYDAPALMELLTDDAVLISDGGGKVRSAINPIISRKRVLALLTSRRAFRKLREWDIRNMDMHDGQSLVYYDELGQAKVVITLELAPDGERIQQVFIIMNPDKLRYLPKLTS